MFRFVFDKNKVNLLSKINLFLFCCVNSLVFFFERFNLKKYLLFKNLHTTLSTTHETIKILFKLAIKSLNNLICMNYNHYIYLTKYPN